MKEVNVDINIYLYKYSSVCGSSAATVSCGVRWESVTHPDRPAQRALYWEQVVHSDRSLYEGIFGLYVPSWNMAATNGFIHPKEICPPGCSVIGSPRLPGRGGGLAAGFQHRFTCKLMNSDSFSSSEFHMIKVGHPKSFDWSDSSTHAPDVRIIILTENKKDLRSRRKTESPSVKTYIHSRPHSNTPGTETMDDRSRTNSRVKVYGPFKAVKTTFSCRKSSFSHQPSHTHAWTERRKKSLSLTCIHPSLVL